MTISRLLWPQDRIDHIARHHVIPDEVDEVCYGRSLILRSKSKGDNPAYYILGQTNSGRYLFCVIITFPDGNGYPVTARDMTKSERQRYIKWLKK